MNAVGLEKSPHNNSSAKKTVITPLDFEEVTESRKTSHIVGQRL